MNPSARLGPRLMKLLGVIVISIVVMKIVVGYYASDLTWMIVLLAVGAVLLVGGRRLAGDHRWR